jgi:hypothetical protein
VRLPQENNLSIVTVFVYLMISTVIMCLILYYMPDKLLNRFEIFNWILSLLVMFFGFGRVLMGIFIEHRTPKSICIELIVNTAISLFILFFAKESSEVIPIRLS